MSSSRKQITKSHGIESTGPSSADERFVRFWGLDFDMDTMKSTKAAKTSLITNTQGADKMQINVTSDLNQPASPKERDFLSSIGHGPIGYLTPRADDAPNMNSFSCKKTLSAAPPVPKERDFLSSFGNGASGSRPLAPPPVAAANMNSTDVEQQATKSFSRRSSFTPYNRQTVRNNIPTTPSNSTHTMAPASNPGYPYGAPSNSQAVTINPTPLNNSNVIPRSTVVPNSSAPSSSSRPEVHQGNSCPFVLMVLGAGVTGPPWTGHGV